MGRTKDIQYIYFLKRIMGLFFIDWVRGQHAYCQVRELAEGRLLSRNSLLEGLGKTHVCPINLFVTSLLQYLIG